MARNPSALRTPASFAALLSILLAALPAGAALLCGDFNGDKSVSASDALGTLRTAVGQQECQRAVCDFTGDGDITAADALAILRLAVGSPGRLPDCPEAGCNGPDCEPTCPDGEVDCCDETTCSGNGTCFVDEGVAACDCKDGWTGATCNVAADLYPFATKPDREPPAWTTAGGLLVRPASYDEQMRHDLPPGTWFVAGSKLAADIGNGKAGTTVPFVFPDGQPGTFLVEKTAEYQSDVLLVERRDEGGVAKIHTRFPMLTIYRSRYEADGSVNSVLELVAVEDGGFTARGIARHESNLPGLGGVFTARVEPVGNVMRLDDIPGPEGEIDSSTLLMTSVSATSPYQAGLFEDCNGLAICDDLCTDMGLDEGEPGPACPAPPEPCDHVSPCGDGYDPGDPLETNHCNDGVNNDGVGGTDSADPQCGHVPTCEPGGDIPPHSHRWEAGVDFGLFGDVTFCTKHGNQWPSKLRERGWHAEFPFHRFTGAPGYDSLYTWGDGSYSSYEKLVRLKVMGCWLLDTEVQAAACANDVADCGPFAAGAHKYPYRFGRDAEGMWDGVRVDVWHAKTIGMTDPLHAAQTVTSALVGASEADHIPGFASVVGTNVSGSLDTHPHELGHSLNLTHCEARLVNGLWSLMGNSLQVDSCPAGMDYGNHQQNLFSTPSGEKLYQCLANNCQSSPGYGDPTPQ